ncbi:MAG: SpoIIE family protein phosphatase [Clostridiales bacterium]|nr:SpoIIE family protein phosphatase [Clostridiales bacterium]MBR6484914.1 SpoIIE family protein phosphatase [Clostridiales bacterium]
MLIELSVLDVGTRALIGFAIIFVIVALSAFVNFMIRSNKMISGHVDDEYLSLDAAYFHEVGKRERQEDAYFISSMEDIKKYGFVVCVADGMGGMKYGKDIADKIADKIEKSCPLSFFASTHNADMIRQLSNELYKNYGGAGGATLAMTHISNGYLNFYSVGDSDIILIRNNEATILNPRQNYVSVLVKNFALAGKQTQAAYANSKGRALVDYMGNENPRVIYTHKPMKLLDGDVIIVSSDGLTDAIPWQTLPSYMNTTLLGTASEIASRLKINVRTRKHPRQDNYTGVVITVKRGLL